MKTRRFRILGKKDAGLNLKSGMILAIEPMVNAGKYKVQDFAGRLDGDYKRWKFIGSF